MDHGVKFCSNFATAGFAIRGDREMKLTLPLWQRLLITVAVMFAASFLAGWIWASIFSFPLPEFAAGVIGGLSALPVWEFLKRIRPNQGE